MNNQPQNESPKRIPAKYSCPSIEADTTKDFIAEVARACPAMRDYLERLVAADQVLCEASKLRSVPGHLDMLRRRWRMFRSRT